MILWTAEGVGRKIRGSTCLDGTEEQKNKTKRNKKNLHIQTVPPFPPLFFSHFFIWRTSWLTPSFLSMPSLSLSTYVFRLIFGTQLHWWQMKHERRCRQTETEKPARAVKHLPADQYMYRWRLVTVDFRSLNSAGDSLQTSFCLLKKDKNKFSLQDNWWNVIPKKKTAEEISHFSCVPSSFVGLCWYEDDARRRQDCGPGGRKCRPDRVRHVSSRIKFEKKE